MSILKFSRKLKQLKAMKNFSHIISLIFIVIYLSSCTSKTTNNEEANTPSESIQKADIENEETNNYQTNISTSSSDDSNEQTSTNSSSCKFDDGTYSATVDYSNSETGYSATYTLDVEVQDCQIVQINFPNDGYLDDDHISYADIDENGNASVDGEDGKSYEIQIDD
jgi:uncharacterized protein with FMN-binding domain